MQIEITQKPLKTIPNPIQLNFKTKEPTQSIHHSSKIPTPKIPKPRPINPETSRLVHKHKTKPWNPPKHPTHAKSQMCPPPAKTIASVIDEGPTWPRSDKGPDWLSYHAIWSERPLRYPSVPGYYSRCGLAGIYGHFRDWRNLDRKGKVAEKWVKVLFGCFVWVWFSGIDRMFVGGGVLISCLGVELCGWFCVFVF